MDPALWCLPAPTTGTGRRRGRRRTPTACRGCRAMTVAAGTTENGGEHARAVGIEGEREVDLTGEAQRPRGRTGVSGREARGGGGSWRPYPPRRRRGGAAGTAPVPTPVGGTGKGARGRGGLAGWAGGRPSWASGPVGGEGPSLSFFLLSVLFSVFFLFVYFLFCFISFKSI